LLAEEQGPEVFADEFNAVEGRLGPWTVGAETVNVEFWVSKAVSFVFLLTLEARRFLFALSLLLLLLL